MNIELNQPRLKGSISLEECIYRRKSVRKFLNKEIELEKISQILWAAQAIKNSNRTVPSAGATYPLEFFVNIKQKGLFYYDFKKRILIQEMEKEISNELAMNALGQRFISQAPVNIIICVDYSRICKRYGDRGIRYAHIEVGHCAQNIHLEAISLGLGSVPIGAFQDNKVKNTLNLSKDLDPLYIIPIGYSQ
jgi:SagB-type dehydrogenase family enzyme